LSLCVLSFFFVLHLSHGLPFLCRESTSQLISILAHFHSFTLPFFKFFKFLVAYLLFAVNRHPNVFPSSPLSLVNTTFFKNFQLPCGVPFICRKSTSECLSILAPFTGKHYLFLNFSTSFLRTFFFPKINIITNFHTLTF